MRVAFMAILIDVIVLSIEFNKIILKINHES